MNRGWNALVDHLPEISTPRGFLRAAIMILLPFGISLGVLWMLRPRSAFLTLVAQVAVLLLARFLLADLLQPTRRPYADAFFNRFLPTVGLHAATVLFILTSSVADVAYEAVIPSVLGFVAFVYLGATGAGLLWRAGREAGIETLSNLYVYFPDDAPPVSGSVYSEIRHPWFAGLARVALAFAALNGTAFALVLAMLFVFVYLPSWIQLEEPELAERYGESYASFAARRPAMFPTSLAGEVDLVRRVFMGGTSSSADATSA